MNVGSKREISKCCFLLNAKPPRKPEKISMKLVIEKNNRKQRKHISRLSSYK